VEFRRRLVKGHWVGEYIASALLLWWVDIFGAMTAYVVYWTAAFVTEMNNAACTAL
jgi:hypothetical protein